MDIEHKIRHLEIIQNIIQRMANHSFFIKGWAITLIAALLALVARNANPAFTILALFPVGLFWIADAYYLHQERLYRRLYDVVRDSQEELNFSLDTSAFKPDGPTWLGAIFSEPLGLFYGSIVVFVGILFSMIRMWIL